MKYTLLVYGDEQAWDEAIALAGRLPSASRHRRDPADRGGSGIMTYALWIVQGLLAAVFLLAGGSKLVLPLHALTVQIPLPGPFVRFIGVAEVLGALGLTLPGVLRVRSGLTPVAAAGLVIVMIGATVFTLALRGGVVALIPGVVGTAAGFVAYGRWRLAPHSGGGRRQGGCVGGAEA